MTFLRGMKEICRYCRRSESTILLWIRDRDLPAKRIGGIWEANPKQIDRWKAGGSKIKLKKILP